MFRLSCVSQPLPVKPTPVYAWPRRALCYGANRNRIARGVSPWNSAAGVFCEVKFCGGTRYVFLCDSFGCGNVALYQCGESFGRKLLVDDRAEGSQRLCSDDAIAVDKNVGVAVTP